MADSIKKQIMARIYANLFVLTTKSQPTPANRVRTLTREMDLLKWSEALPAIMIYDGDEEIVDEDERGITLQFPIGIKCLWADNRDLSTIKDALVPEVQRIMESDIQLNGLANWVKGGAEQPFIQEVGKPHGGCLVIYEVEYRRRRGDPYTAY